MFCSGCGTQLQPHFQACPTCGRAVPASVAISLPGRVEQHVRVLGILWIVAGALFLIPGLLLFVLSTVVRISIPPAETVGRVIGPLVLSVIGAALFLTAAAGIVVGWGLLRHLPWARIAAIVLGVFSLLHPPFGTALGIYTLWVLLSDQGGVEYERLVRAA